MSAPIPPADARRPLGGVPEAFAPGGAPRPIDRRADPLRWCVLTTVALLAWLLGPPVVVAAMAALGLAAYARAMRRGLTSTRCVLTRPTLVLAYLSAACAAGVAGTAIAVARALR